MCVDHLCTLPSMPDGGTADDGGTAGGAAVTDDGGAAPTGKPRPQTSYCSIGHGSPSATSVGFVAMALALLASRRRRRERRSQSASLVGLVALVLASSTPIAPCEAQEVTDASEAATSYDETIRQAVTEFDASRFEEARALFRQAHAIEPNARTLRGIGMSSFELRDYVDAALSFRASLAETRRPLTPQQRTQTRSLLRQAELFVSRHPLDLAPANATLRIDGAPATIVDGELWMNPGAHQLRVEASGFMTHSEPIQASSGANPVLAIHLEAVPTPVATPVVPAAEVVAEAPIASEPPPVAVASETSGSSRTGRRRWSWALIGAGAGVAAGGMLAGGLILRRQDERLAEHCGSSVGLPSDQCEDSAVVDDAESKSTMARVLGFTSLGVGLGAAGAGVLLLVLKPREADAAPRAVTPTAACGTTGCVAGAVGRF